MRINNIPVRYIGQLFSPNYAVHTIEFLSIEHAREYLADLYIGEAEDEILLFPCDIHDSKGEAYSRTESTDNASHIVKRGPRGGITVERI